MIIVRRAAVPLLLIISAELWAGDIPCNRDGTQSERTTCAYEDFLKADRELNETYQSVLRDIEKIEGGDILARKLRQSQRAWIKFRDAELEATYTCVGASSFDECWGSVGSYCYNKYKATLTNERTARLKRFLSDGWPSDGCM